MKQFFAGMLCMSSLMLLGFQFQVRMLNPGPNQKVNYTYAITEHGPHYGKFDESNQFGKLHNKVINQYASLHGRLIQIVMLKERVDSQHTLHYYWEKKH